MGEKKMKFKEGDKVIVKDSRKGTFAAVVSKPFDSEADEWYSVRVDQKEPVVGLSATWESGEEIPCRKGHATIARRKD
jgi:hypothetical protein